MAEKIKLASLDYYQISASSDAAQRFDVSILDASEIDKNEKVKSASSTPSYKIILPFADARSHQALIDSVVERLPQLESQQLSVANNIPISAAKTSPIPNVKNVIAVSSGKGGVGKSATAVNLAFALQAQGARVGILDADIYGPSIPIMLGNPQAQPKSEDQKIMQPLSSQGLVANSIGYLVSSESAAIWRGPMATKAIKQLTYETQWPLLDYLIVDLPPGTGDIHLTLAQSVPISAAVIVSTPQTIATADAKKGIAMFEKLDIPVLGIVENMSYFECKCGEKSYPFSQGGSQKLAQQFDIEVLGELPLNQVIRECADEGTSLMASSADAAQSVKQIYLDIASNVSRDLGLYGKLHQLVHNSSTNADLGIPVVNKS